MMQSNQATTLAKQSEGSCDAPIRTGPPVSWMDAWTRPMPGLRGQWLTQFLTRGTLSTFRRRILKVEGLEHLVVDQDPFILALNHSQKLEAIILPGLCFFLRGGKRVHFLADWNFCLIPGVYLFYLAGQTITLTRKPAKPAFLDIFRPLFTDKVPAFERARQRLDAGDCVGIFPEGTTNRNPDTLLKGFSGAARLSLESGVPVVPAGVRFPNSPPDQPIAENEPFEIHVGAPMKPGAPKENPSLRQVRDWHHAVMSEIGRLSGKAWDPKHSRKKQCP